MFKRSGALAAVCAMLLAGIATSAADARDGVHRHRHHHPVKRIEIRTKVKIIDNRTVINIGRVPQRTRHHRGLDSYSGDVVISVRPGTGTWSYGTLGRRDSVVRTGQRAKIVDLTSGRNDCRMESGVCVIRP